MSVSRTWKQDQGFTRRNLRQGSGKSVEQEHYDEVLGSSEFYIYVSPNKKLKGYDALTQYLEYNGSEVQFPAESPLRPGKEYKVIKIMNKGVAIPVSGLRRAHKWAHQRNFLHSFFKPLHKPPQPDTANS